MQIVFKINVLLLSLLFKKFVILSSKLEYFSSLFYFILYLNSRMYGGRAPKGSYAIEYAYMYVFM